jgi:hypothetical protein
MLYLYNKIPPTIRYFRKAFTKMKNLIFMKPTTELYLEQSDIYKYEYV